MLYNHKIQSEYASYTKGNFLVMKRVILDLKSFIIAEEDGQCETGKVTTPNPFFKHEEMTTLRMDISELGKQDDENFRIAHSPLQLKCALSTDYSHWS